MAYIEAVLSYLPVLLAAYLIHQNYQNGGIAKSIIGGLMEWIEKGELK